MRILLVEDDFMIGKSTKKALELNNNVVDLVNDCENAYSAVKTTNFDLIILDLNLPDGSGLEFLSKIRNQKKATPVLILTALSDVSQKIKGLDSGADDYLTKPFDLEELLARIRSLARRSAGISNPILLIKNLKLDPAKHLLTKDEIAIDLSPKEFAILKLLMENQNNVVSKSRLENLLYSWDDSVESNTIEVYIHNLRKKLGAEVIKTVRGIGYKVN